ncbi:hypothetical protein VHA01S_008_00950 [Vibrio halioticoli NBRC 102217]|uniref:PIN-like domain-containing protein n=1 Tax=Vibrio halioticoli NBRC 102217 TaxID=1219072 RepID=V5HGZ1_9VIBR|nr:hypothetical protein [Vibrio halioticoli]GAD88700.1 hypothetical protein VHA01S_008_00950 [Vibrio halioticoli NBRC 102217]
MKMIFVDAENVGLKELGKLTASIVDKVFVFSKSDSVKLMCEKSLYLFLNDYPSGQNQADFYIIAYLSRVLSALDKRQLGSTHFELYSNDESLISAFEFQCDQLGSACKSIRTREQTVVPILKPQPLKSKLSKPTSTIPNPPKINSSKPHSPEEKMLKALTSPRTLDPSLQKQLNLSQSDFTKVINALRSTQKIKRTEESKKKWVRC